LAADLDNKYFKQYKNNIRLRTDDQDSYDHFWKPIRTQLDAMPGGTSIKKIYFSPDGVYHLINISTLKNPASGKYILDEMQILNTVSGADIHRKTETNGDIKTAVLIGRPAFKFNETTIAKIDKDNARSWVNQFRDADIPDLPGTEQEVLAIKKEMEQNKIDVTAYL